MQIDLLNPRVEMISIIQVMKTDVHFVLRWEEKESTVPDGEHVFSMDETSSTQMARESFCLQRDHPFFHMNSRMYIKSSTKQAYEQKLLFGNILPSQAVTTLEEHTSWCRTVERTLHMHIV